MLNEPGALLDDERRSGRPSSQFDEPDHTEDALLDEADYFALQELIQSVMTVHTTNFPAPDHPLLMRADLLVMNPESQLVAEFRGRLTLESEIAYEHLNAEMMDADLLPLFRRDADDDVIYVVSGRGKPVEGGGWLALIMFVLTLLSLLYVGTIMAVGEIRATNPFLANRIEENLLLEMWRGLPYALSIALILGAHELGHYFASRFHRTATSLPYFIPFPLSLFGTFGAAIRLREPMRNRKILLDIGAAGPLAGLVFAIPILLIGLATSTVGPIAVNGFTEGNSLTYALAKIITFGRFLPDGRVDVYVNQLAWAGWTGLFVTGINLIPLGQLDGGHVLYSLIGRRARLLYYPAIVILGGLVLLTNNALIVMLVLLVLLGRVHATPLDDITPLDFRRKVIAVLTLLVFVFVFVPIPLTESGPGITNPDSRQSIGLIIALVWTSRHQWMYLSQRLWRKVAR
ncbi:MAG: site-2 protease family protein [Aggregatilineales bacterium]